MLPFFRKIRFQLAQDNQFFKYSRYAIGEIVLVVVGILIALQINNWNERRQLKESLNVYLGRLIEDLKDDQIRMSNERKWQQFRYHSMQQLLVYADLEKNTIVQVAPEPYQGKMAGWEMPFPDEIDGEFLKTTFEWTSRMARITLTTSTFDEMKSSGLFSFIDDERLRNSINEYYVTFDYNLGVSENNNLLLFRNSWTNQLAENGFNSYGRTDYTGIINWIKNDSSGEATLRNLISNAEWRYQSCGWQINHAIELSNEINKYMTSN